jgi:hypothetical protein
MRVNGVAAALAAVVALAAPVGARAGDLFEIQVYEGDIGAPGEMGLELHLNYTFDGQTAPAFPGEVPPDRVARATLEPSLGVLPWLELGAYLPFYLEPGGAVHSGGWKLRTKLMVPEAAGWPVRVGLNVELARLPDAVDQADWGLELRPILAWEGGRWLLAFNPILDLPLTGPDAGAVELEPALKARWDTGLGFGVGAEYYAGLGPIGNFDPVHQQSHLLFAVVDVLPRPGEPEGPWELNLGLGFALTEATPQHVVGKAILGRSF